MLVLSRKIGEGIVVGDTTITVTEVDGDKVKLSVVGSTDVTTQPASPEEED